MDELYPTPRIVSYALVDPAIREWCNRHSLTLYTSDKGSDVRTVQVVGATGTKCQIWVDPPQDDSVTIHVGHMRHPTSA